MERIISHWTGGTHSVSAEDKRHYHIIIDGDGVEHKGAYNIEANLNTKDGHYAAHTQGCNTNSIGVSCCAMAGAKEKPLSFGDYPITEVQWAKLVEVNARLCREYGIEVTRQTVLTHAEVQQTLGIKQRQKWDISVLKFRPDLKGALAVGDFLRASVKAKLAKMPKRNALMIEPKPVLAHRRVKMLLGSAGGASTIIGWFTGWEWQAIAVMAGFFTVVALVFMVIYREEIRAGVFAPVKK
jgi:hypothetical protein